LSSLAFLRRVIESPSWINYSCSEKVSHSSVEKCVLNRTLVIQSCVEAVTKENNLMNTTTNTPLVIAFVIVVGLFLGFGGGAMTGGMMNGGINGSGWMGERNWMWTPALVTLGLGVVLGWLIFKKKG
jgi:hypothetical protein